MFAYTCKQNKKEHEQTAQASNTETAQWRAGPSVAQSEGVNPIIYAGVRLALLF